MIDKITNSKTNRSGKVSNNNILTVKLRTERNRLAPLKFITIIFLVLGQVAILALAHLFLLSVFKWFVGLSMILSFITAIYILSSNKNSGSKAVWVLVVMIFFLFGYLIYFMSDDRFSFYRSRKRYNKIYEESKEFEQNADNFEIENKQIEASCKFLKSAGGFDCYSKTNLKYYSSGTLLFDSIIEELEKAQQFIFIEYYIISDGILFSRILDILKKKAQEGVEIKIIYDDLGSMNSLSFKTKKEMKNAGIKFGKFNPLVSRFSVALNFRDHRKIVVIDGKVAFTGGANLADEYINEKRLHGYWKDSGIKLSGKAVDNFTLAFLRQWKFVKKEDVNYKNYFKKAEDKNNSSTVVPFVDGLNFNVRIGKGLVESIICNATKKLWIMTPYFVPDDTITNLLLQKAMSGVDVRIVLPEVADKKIVYIASRNNAEKLISGGVKIFTMKNSFVHSKLVISENSALVGSINIDLRSFYQQFESAVFTDDKSVLKDITKDFENVFSVSTKVEEENSQNKKLSTRIVAGILRIIMPFM